jgi:hypothetical protein
MKDKGDKNADIKKVKMNIALAVLKIIRLFPIEEFKIEFVKIVNNLS